MNWKDELALLNDEQLERIAFAKKDSWGKFYYDKPTYQSCVLGHIFGFRKANQETFMSEYRQRLSLNRDVSSPLEKYYMNAWRLGICNLVDWEAINPIHPEIIEEIQNHAKHLLEERRMRIQEEQVIVK